MQRSKDTPVYRVVRGIEVVVTTTNYCYAKERFRKLCTEIPDAVVYLIEENLLDESRMSEAIHAGGDAWRNFVKTDSP